jgi:acyl-CoA thioester hydrolase
MKPEIILPTPSNPRVPAPAQPFRSVLPLQIRFNDIDMLGHVNNSVYLSYFDLGKVNYFQEIMPEGVDMRHINAVIANVNCDFFSATTLDEQICVVTAVTHIGDSSFRLEQRIIDVETGDVKCVARTVMVSIDPATGKSAPVNPAWIRAVEEFEGRTF